MSQWRERHVQNWAYDGHTENVRQCLVHSRRDAFELADPDGGIPKTALHQVAESATSGPLMKDINFDRLCDTLDLLVEYGGPEACRVVDPYHETTALHWTSYGGGSKGAAYVARKMLECGVDVNSTSNEGATALDLCALTANWRVASVLLAANAIVESGRGPDECLDSDSFMAANNEYASSESSVSSSNHSMTESYMLFRADQTPLVISMGKVIALDPDNVYYAKELRSHLRLWPRLLRAGANLPSSVRRIYDGSVQFYPIEDVHPYLRDVYDEGGFERYANMHKSRLVDTFTSMLSEKFQPAVDGPEADTSYQKKIVHLIVEYYLEHAGHSGRYLMF